MPGLMVAAHLAPYGNRSRCGGTLFLAAITGDPTKAQALVEEVALEALGCVEEHDRAPVGVDELHLVQYDGDLGVVVARRVAEEAAHTPDLLDPAVRTCAGVGCAARVRIAGT